MSEGCKIRQEPELEGAFMITSDVKNWGRWGIPAHGNCDDISGAQSLCSEKASWGASGEYGIVCGLVKCVTASCR